MPEPTKPTHRLQRITVQEVSLVDRAANQRRFLVTKREEPMKPKPTSKPVKKDDAAAATAAVADETTTDAGAGGGIQAQVKEGLTQALAALAEKIVSVANEVDALEVTDQVVDPAVPAAITSQLEEVKTMLAELASKFGGAAASTDETSTDTAAVTADADGAKAGETPAPATKAEDDKEPPTDQEKAAVKEAEDETLAKGLDPIKSVDLVAKSVAARLSIPLEKAQVVVSKVGRRMAKKRMEQLGKAIDMLVTLMKELRYESEKKAKAATEAVIGKSATPATDVAVTADPSTVEALLASAESLIEISKSHETAASTLRAELAKARSTIARLEKVTPGSNALPVEKAGGGSGASAWPIWDMNAKQPAQR